MYIFSVSILEWPGRVQKSIHISNLVFTTFRFEKRYEFTNSETGVTTHINPNSASLVGRLHF